MKKLFFVAWVISMFVCSNYPVMADEKSIEEINALLEEEKREAEQLAKYKLQPKTGFGSQIRNYFLHPDQRVKDQRTGHYVGNFQSVLDGNLDGFLDAYLRWKASDAAPVAVDD